MSQAQAFPMSSQREALLNDKNQINAVMSTVLNRLATVDRLSKIMENTLDAAEALGSPLTLAPGSVGYEESMKLFINLVKANKDLVESFRKLKTAEVDIRAKEQRLELQERFTRYISGVPTEEIRKQVQSGNFMPANEVVGAVFANAVVDNDSTSARTLMRNIGDWDKDEPIDLNVTPSLTVNLDLPEETREEMRLKIVNNKRELDGQERVPETV